MHVFKLFNNKIKVHLNACQCPCHLYGNKVYRKSIVSGYILENI